MDIRVVESEGAPAPIGPYSQALVSGGFVFCSGQIPLDPATGALVEGGMEAQTGRVLDNLEAVLRAAGSSLHQAVRLTVYLKDLADFGTVNRVLEARLRPPYPARSTVQVAALPKGASVEIDVVAAPGPA
jgi:reactive intermediate/imine deaminase